MHHTLSVAVVASFLRICKEKMFFLEVTLYQLSNFGVGHF